MTMEFKALPSSRSNFAETKSPLTSQAGLMPPGPQRPPMLAPPGPWPSYSSHHVAALLSQSGLPSPTPGRPSTGPTAQHDMPPPGAPPGVIPASLMHLAGGTSLMENWENWRQFQQAAYANNLDPHLLAFYHNGGCPVDLTNAPRRKNATRETTSMLKAWLNEHRKNPYPTKGEKIMLAIITKMTLTQVSTWFANARRRLKKENKMTWSPRNRSEEERERCGPGRHGSSSGVDHSGRPHSSDGEDQDYEDDPDAHTRSHKMHLGDVGDLDDFDEEDRETLKRLESSAAAAGFFSQSPGGGASFNPSLFPAFIAAQQSAHTGVLSNTMEGHVDLKRSVKDNPNIDEPSPSKIKKPKIWSIVDTATKETEDNDNNNDRESITKSPNEGSNNDNNNKKDGKLGDDNLNNDLLHRSTHPLDLNHPLRNHFLLSRSGPGFPVGHPGVPVRGFPPAFLPGGPQPTSLSSSANLPPPLGCLFTGGMPQSGLFMSGTGAAGNTADCTPLLNSKMFQQHVQPFPPHPLFPQRLPTPGFLRGLHPSHPDVPTAQAMAAAAAASYLQNSFYSSGVSAPPLSAAALMSALRTTRVSSSGPGLMTGNLSDLTASLMTSTNSDAAILEELPPLSIEPNGKLQDQKCPSVTSSTSSSPSK